MSRDTCLLTASLPPLLTQIACASAVVRYCISWRACGVSLNMANESPATTWAPAYWELMSGSGKKLKSVTGCSEGRALVKKLVMNEAWLGMWHFGGFANI